MSVQLCLRNPLSEIPLNFGCLVQFLCLFFCIRPFRDEHITMSNYSVPASRCQCSTRTCLRPLLSCTCLLHVECTKMPVLSSSWSLTILGFVYTASSRYGPFAKITAQKYDYWRLEVTSELGSPFLFHTPIRPQVRPRRARAVT